MAEKKNLELKFAHKAHTSGCESINATDRLINTPDLNSGDQLARGAEAGQLGELLEHLPAATAGAERPAMQRITASLAHALGASVVVSDQDRGVLAASPQRAPATTLLADAVARHSVLARTRTAADPARHIVPLPSGTGAVLAVAARSALTTHDTRLIRQAAGILGLVDQVQRQRQAGAHATTGARVACWQLLANGRVAMARQVASAVSPGLLDPPTARLYVIDCGRDGRDVTATQCEAVLTDRAMIVKSPEVSRHLIVIEPLHRRTTAVVQDLSRLVRRIGGEHVMGGSGPYALNRITEGYREALTALRFASRQPASISLGPEPVPLLSLIDPAAARHWALGLLQPIMTLPEPQRQQLLGTLPVALSCPYTTAARRLAVHRNTVHSHMAKASQLLGMDLTGIVNRVLVNFALDVLRQSVPAGGAFWPAHDLHSLLADPEPREWAEGLLRPLTGGGRDLLRTVQTWLECEVKVQRAARKLGLSEATVRNHLSAIADLTLLDLNALSGIQDLMLALHITRGQPLLREPLAAAA